MDLKVTVPDKHSGKKSVPTRGSLCTHKGSICNVEPRRITTSYNAQEDMHWDKIDNECVASPRADLEKPSI
jgi:hypothetical protein